MISLLLVTGPPDVGKNHGSHETVNMLRQRGVNVGGMLNREVRDKGVRASFEIQDLVSERRRWLAHLNKRSGPQVGT